MGRRKRPFYRIVAIDSRKRRDGREIERLGWFDPLKTDVAVELKEDRIIHWLKKGAQPSETIGNILIANGLKYKLHLIREGKSEGEIASALTEWQLRQEEIKVNKKDKKAKKKAISAKSKPVAESEESGDTKSDDSPEKVSAKNISPEDESAAEATSTESEKETADAEAVKEDSPEDESTAEVASTESSSEEEINSEADQEDDVSDESSKVDS